jgi:hypothetical protein
VGISSKEPSSSPPIDHQTRDLHWPPSKGSSLATKQGIFIDHQTWDSPLTTKQGIFIDHQAWDPPLTIKHGILPPPFSFSLKGGSDDWGALFFALENFLEYLFHKLFEGKWG